MLEDGVFTQARLKVQVLIKSIRCDPLTIEIDLSCPAERWIDRQNRYRRVWALELPSGGLKGQRKQQGNLRPRLPEFNVLGLIDISKKKINDRGLDSMSDAERLNVR